jgi:hypothetical protein
MTAVAELVGDRPDVVVVHDAVVAPSGVWVVRISDLVGRVQVRGRGLTVGGRDQSGVLAALASAVGAASDAVAGEAAVTGAICLTRGNLPLLRTAKVGGYPVLSPRGLHKRLGAEAMLDAERRLAIAERLR